jgi:Flp pilus assembly protein TadD
MRRLAILTLTVLILTVAGSARAGYEEGVAAFRAGNFAAAAREFRLALEAQPAAASLHYMLGASLFRLQRLDEAVASLGKAVELAPEEPSYALTLAQARLAAGAPEAAFAVLSERRLASLPAAVRDPWARGLAAAAERLDDPGKGLAALDAAAKEAPASAALQRARGRAVAAAGRPAEAFAAYSRADELEPGEGDAGRRAVDAAFAAARSADEAEAKSWYLKAAGLAEALTATDPTPDGHLLAGEAWMGAGDYPRARGHFQAAAAAQAAAPLPRYYLGRCAFAEGDAEAALRHLDESVSLAPDADLRARIQAARGIALHQLHRFDLAAAAYRAAGDPVQAAEMVRLGKLADGNDEIDRRRAACEAKRAEAERLRDENRDLAGTPDWRLVLQQIDKILADCRPYLDEGDGFGR